MGSYAGIRGAVKNWVAEDKREEFEQKIEKLFVAGGMMDMECVRLFGKQIKTIHKVRMEDDGMSFHYNYLENDSWENAGFDRKNCDVWSNKIGNAQFHHVIVAAYVLQEQYIDGIAMVAEDGEFVTSWAYVGWINYLFDEKNHVRNFDPWKIFELIYDDNSKVDNQHYYRSLYNTGDKRYAFIGGCEVYAVLNGYEEAIEFYDAMEKDELEDLILDCMKEFIDKLSVYKSECREEQEIQVGLLLDAIDSYYKTDEKGIDKLNIENERIRDILIEIVIFDAPAFALKVISEMYELNFWDLWNNIKDVARRKHLNIYGNNGHYILPYSTEKFLRQTRDDMIPYWEDNGKLIFSDELEDWFKYLREEYDCLLETDFTINSVLHYVMDLLEKAEENYYHIYVFNEFFEDTMDNLNDKRYQVLWKIFDNMINDPEMKKAGDVIFAPEDKDDNKTNRIFFDDEPKRRLVTGWGHMSLDKKNNKARVTLRRYMALMGNRALRYKVFGV